MDSPVDGVRECITQVYKMSLALHVNASSENKDVSAENGNISSVFTARILRMGKVIFSVSLSVHTWGGTPSS